MLTMTDLFAGAGGTSTGAASVPGVHVAVAANHWKLAVNVHAENHQDTDHACVDLHMEDPRNFPRTELLWASPECFTAGHLVTTRRGQVPIELVEVGDVVLTHRNRWRPVVRVQARMSKNVVTELSAEEVYELPDGARFQAITTFQMRSPRELWRTVGDPTYRLLHLPEANPDPALIDLIGEDAARKIAEAGLVCEPRARL